MKVRSKEELTEQLQRLRGLPGIIRQPVARKEISCSLLEEGLPCGALTEVSGSLGGGKTEFVLRLLAEHPEARTAWIEPALTVYPTALSQQGVSLSNVLFIEAGKDWLWATLQVLKSQLFSVVVLTLEASKQDQSAALRRLQLSAERSGTALILLHETSLILGHWLLARQIEVERNPDGLPGELNVRTVRGRFSEKRWKPKVA